MNQELRECQKVALYEFQKYYYDEGNDRGIISMCCGSGKTYVAYNIIKLCYQTNERFFIITTSRVKLLYQMLDDYEQWISNDNIDMEIRVLGGDDNKYRKKKMYNETEVEDAIGSILGFQKRSLLIISTYNSCDKIMNTLKNMRAKTGEQTIIPDLVILDEAHNTTGENQKYHQTLIKKSNDEDDKTNISFNKYLFMTATPVKFLLKNKSAPFQNDETVFSMDNENIYGKIVYEYSFYEGIRDTWLTPIKTVYLAPNNKIPDEIEERLKGKNKSEKSNIYFENISEFLLNSISKYGLKYILVFLKNQSNVRTMKIKLTELLINSVNLCNIYQVV